MDLIGHTLDSLRKLGHIWEKPVRGIICSSDGYKSACVSQRSHIDDFVSQYALYSILLASTVVIRPAVIRVNINVSSVFEAFVDYCMGSVHYLLCVDVAVVRIPRIPSQGW